MTRKRVSKYDCFAEEWVKASKSGESTLSIATRYNANSWSVNYQFGRLGYKPAIWLDSILESIDAAWIAAVLDCEGTLTIHTPWNKYRNNRNIQTVVRVNMVELGVLEKLYRLCGGTFCGPKTNKSRPNSRPSYIWNVSSNGARWLLPQVMPYLIIKKRHAEIMLEILDNNRRGARTNQMKFEDLRPLLVELRSLNQRGVDPHKPNLDLIVGTKLTQLR